MPALLDCRGLTCPEPVVRSKALLNQDHPREVDILVDNPASHENVSRFWEKNGYTVESRKTDENEWCIHAVGDGEKRPVQDADAYVACSTDYRTLVLITTETLGRGDDELGTKLMANFLGTLPELSNLWRIVLLNGGVKLSAKEGAALDNLKKLADSGVSVLVCGTCLDHYGLLEQKKVGETTNMMDIVTSLALANKVIRP